jgi:hypothetical protein
MNTALSIIFILAAVANLLLAIDAILVVREKKRMRKQLKNL